MFCFYLTVTEEHAREGHSVSHGHATLVLLHTHKSCLEATFVHYGTCCILNTDARLVTHQHRVVRRWLAGEEGEHGAQVRLLELESQRAAHLPPQGGFLVRVTRQSHGHHVQVQVGWREHQRG